MDLYERSPLYHLIDEGRLIIAHAGIRSDYIGQYSSKVKTFVLYGDINGSKHPMGLRSGKTGQNHTKGNLGSYMATHLSLKLDKSIIHTILILAASSVEN